MEAQKALNSPTSHSLHTSADDTDNDDVFVDVRGDIMDDTSTDWTSRCVEEKRCESAIQSTDVSSNDTLSQDITPQSTSLTAEIDISNGPEPTSPPASSLDDVLRSEKEFIEYVLSLPSSGGDEPIKSRSKKSSNRSVTKGGSGTKVGLDHLDNLCKLMEQLSELREANSKLQKRVQYLEDLKSLHEMHKEVNNAINYESDNVLSAEIPEKKMVHLDYICMESQEVVERPSSRSKERRYVVHKSKTQVNISRTQAGRTRERSKSVGHEEICDTKSKRIFPKWSRVKEALKLEKAPYARTLADYQRKTQATNERLIHSEQAGILRVPIDSDDFQRDDDDSLTGDFYRVTRGYSPVAHSSMEDLRDVIEPNSRRGKWKSQSVYVTEKRSLEVPQDHQRRQKTPSPTYRTIDMAGRRQKSLTLERDLDPEQVFSKYEKEEMKKSHKSPWGRVKTIIQSRKDSLRRRQRQNGGLRYTEADANQEIPVVTESGEESNQRIYRKNSYFESSESSPNLSSGYAQNHSGSLEATDSDRIERKCKPKPFRLPSPGGEETSHQDRPPSFYGDGDKELLRTPSSSPSYQRKSRWTKVKRVLVGKKDTVKSHSVPSSPRDRLAFHYGDEYDNETEYPEISQSRCSNTERDSSDSVPMHAKLVASHSAPVVDIMEELQRNLSEDFSRKIREWEKIRSGGTKLPSPKFERKGSGLKTRKMKQEKTKVDKQDKASKHKMKDLNWLDKELQKIEKEKMRLAKEKQKYEERAKRLEKLRETVLNARTDNKKEVLVKTSAGEFRFQGISNAFTKKLYEWETKLGVGPELSTLALLHASVKTSPAGDRHAGIQRGLSKSESSIIEVGQPSHNSSNSLPSLKPDNDLTAERHQPSRANSEPELVSYGQQKEVNLPTRFQSGDVISNLTSQTYSPPEVTHLIDSDSEEGLTEKSDQQAQSDDNYYSLLEENVLLLEQLKNKEDICRRLERELGNLDLKMEEMNKHHKEELEKYKEKLWEIHGPRNKPRDTQACLRMLAKLKNRIEELESCGERLRNDRQNLEDSFRYHCQQQAQMTVDLIGKMKELQEACSPKSVSGTATNNAEDKTVAIFDRDNVTRLHHLSTQLLKQTQNLEQALADRTREVCHLRWELLHRDVSAIRLHTELHRVRWQGGTARAAAKRAKFAEKRSLSSSERLFPWEKENETRQELPERLLQQSSEAYNEWGRVDFQTTGLTTTVHELNKELLKLSSKTDNTSKSDSLTNTSIYDSLVEKNQEGQAADQPSGDGSVNYCTVSSTSAMEKCDVGQIKVRRNSADNISNLSESLSLNEGERTVKPVQYQRKVSNISSSSESVGVDEECFTKVTIESGKGSKHPLLKDSFQQLVLQYPTKTDARARQSCQKEENNKEIISKSPIFQQNSFEMSKFEEKTPCTFTIQTSTDSENTSSVPIISRDHLSANTVSCNNQLKPLTKDNLIHRSQSSDYPHGNVQYGRLNGESGHTESLKANSPIIRARSPRKLKREFSHDSSEPPCNNDHRVLRKSISQPECGVKYTHFKRHNAPNVSSLIQKYNQKIMEHQGFFSHSTEQTSTGRNCAALAKSKISIEEIPVSPSLQARAQNLRKAKEEFIAGNSYTKYTPSSLLKTPEQNTSVSEEYKYLYPDNDSLSTNSAVSTDSVNLVLCRSAKSCRESRMARRSLAERQSGPGEEISPPTSPTSPDIKSTGKATHFLNFKLRKSKKKKELASISELCRQSLFLNIENAKSEEDKSPTVSPQSCPSSPELRPKPTKPKSSWLHKTIFKQTQS